MVAYYREVRQLKKLNRFIKTPIMSDKVIETLISKGINFAKAEDACKALLRFATDKSVNGMYDLNVGSERTQLTGVIILRACTDDRAPGRCTRWIYGPRP